MVQAYLATGYRGNIMLEYCYPGIILKTTNLYIGFDYCDFMAQNAHTGTSTESYF